MLLTTRWRSDAAAGAADPVGDANMYSWHYRSRLDVGLAKGGRFNCEDLRRGCRGQPDRSSDGGPTEYSFVLVNTAPDVP